VAEGLKVRAQQNSTEPSRRASFCLALTIVLALGLRMMVSILLHPLRIGWDIALHLMCAALICQGKLPYVDMFDVNPPLIWYINTIPASLANLLNFPVTLTFNFFLLFIMVISGLMCFYVILTKLERKDLFVGSGIVLGLLLFNFFLTVDFGQREEIFVLLFIPFFFLRLARWSGCPISRREAVLYGLVGATGIFMKHYFILNFIVVELFFLLASKAKTFGDRLKPVFTAEILTLCVFGGLYAGHFLLMPAQVRHNYFDFLLPAFSKGYYFWDTTVPNCMAVPTKRNVFLLFTASGALAFSMLRVYPLLGPLISFSLFGIVVYLIQFKGWAYQDIPVMAGGFMLGGALLGALVSWIVVRLKHKKNAASIAAYSLSVIVAGTCLVSASEESNQVSSLPRFDMSVLGYGGSAPMEDINTPFTDLILANTKAQEPIVFISNAVSPGFPIILQLRRSPASRHLHVCILSVLRYISEIEPKDAECKRLMAYEPKVVAELGEDISKTRPKLVFLQDQPIKSDYLKPYNFEQKYLSGYKQIDDIAGFSVYKLATPAGVPASPAATQASPGGAATPTNPARLPSPATGAAPATPPSPATGVAPATPLAPGSPAAPAPNVGVQNGK